MQRETVDKIVGSYFASMAVNPFTYKGKEYRPRELHVSPLLFRGLDCPPNCAGCCPSFTLDYLPHEAPHDPRLTLHPHDVSFNGKSFPILRYDNDPKKHFCNFVNMDDGRCMIHTINPFSCSFEIMRFLVSEDHARFLVRKFGRGWSMLRVDGERGARCGILPFDAEIKSWLLSQVSRLRQWMVYFELDPQRCDILTAHIQSGPHDTFLRLGVPHEALPSQ